MDAPFPEGMVEELEDLLSMEDVFPAGLDSYDHFFGSRLNYPLQRRAELEGMIRLARLNNCTRHVLAIGIDKGGDPYHWLKCLEPERFVGIEIRGIPGADLLSRAFPDTSCLFLGASSYAPETVEGVREFLGDEYLDLAFIDGDKANFLADFDAYLPMVREGGLVFMHDVADRDPGRAFEKAKRHARVRRAFQVASTVETAEALSAELAGVPAASPHEAWLREWAGKSCTVGVLWV